MQPWHEHQAEALGLSALVSGDRSIHVKVPPELDLVARALDCLGAAQLQQGLGYWQQLPWRQLLGLFLVLAEGMLLPDTGNFQVIVVALATASRLLSSAAGMVCRVLYAEIETGKRIAKVSC